MPFLKRIARVRETKNFLPGGEYEKGNASRGAKERDGEEGRSQFSRFGVGRKSEWRRVGREGASDAEVMNPANGREGIHLIR